MKKIILAVIFSLIPVASNAFTGMELHNWCLSSEKMSPEADACTIYLKGFVDGVVTGNALGIAHTFCPPMDGISGPQARLILEKYFRDHPEKLDQEAGLLAEVAIREAFPCASK
jgi:hypothetical protein